jgi:orotidine-5'-phosphate decarboxylase
VACGRSRSTTLALDPRLLVAIDVETLAEADRLLDSLTGLVSGCKIGSQLFTAAGPAAVEHARKRGFAVFLDLKFHDIPTTVTGAVREATRLGVSMLTVHASGGLAMMRSAGAAAIAAAAELGVPAPLCLAVTVLTSLDRAALEHDLGLSSTVDGQVLRLAARALAAGLPGCVASPREIRSLRMQFPRTFAIVTPGIRPAAVALPAISADDQARTATPAAAIAAGADYVVVGRPITAAPDPAKAARTILEEMAGAA